MHNFAKPVKPVKDALKSVGKGLHSPKKEFFASNEVVIESLYNEYDVKAEKDELHLLSQQWPINVGDSVAIKKDKTESRHYANQLYGDDRPFINEHWEYLTDQNGGETLYCPICGLHECEEMDHFVPRDESEYPEYSAHLSNLIPLCHNCNHKKSSKFLDDAGKRLFFNAFYDLLTKRDVVVCEITNSPKDGLPQVEAKVNPTLSETQKPDMYILSTISELNLMKRFDDKAKQWLKKEMNRLERRAGQDWDSIKAEMKPLVSPAADDPDIVYSAVIGAIVDSDVMEKWFKSL